MPDAAFTGQIKELSEVVLARPIEVQGVFMPAGGVVMAAWADGLAYEVEFWRLDMRYLQSKQRTFYNRGENGNM